MAKYFYTIVSDKENHDNLLNAITTNPGKQKIINKQIGRKLLINKKSLYKL